jgi:aquaporin Z
MCYAIGPISGCHINPAVTVGMWAGGRFPTTDVIPYIIAQVIGGIAAAGLLFVIASGQTGFDVHAGFASNGFGDHSPGGYTMLACAVCEITLTAMFILIIALSTDKLAPAGFAGLAIGLSLTLIHLVSIPVTNTSVNPARSLGPALFAQGWALQQVWFFWVMPLIGALIGGAIYRYLGSTNE